MRRLSVAVVVVVCLSGLAGGRAQARPEYGKVFRSVYRKSHPKMAEKSCTVCHGKTGSNKMDRTDYGKAFGKALGGKNVKDEQKILEALKAVEKELPSAD